MNKKSTEEFNFEYEVFFLSVSRESLNTLQQQILEMAWKEYFETGNNLPFRIIPRIIGKQPVKDFLETLKAFVSQDFDDHGHRAIKLNILGALITGQGSKLAGLLVQLLDLVREQYESNYAVSEIHSSLLQEQKGLSNNQLSMLFRLIKLYGIYNLPITFHSTYSSLDWKISVTDQVVEFLEYQDSGDCLTQSLQKFFMFQMSEKPQILSAGDFFTSLSSQNESVIHSSKPSFISDFRLEELGNINHPDFDCTRLIAMCKELNDCAQQGNVNAVAMLTRAILDHVPPIFGYDSFKQVVANYGVKSFKGSCKRLDEQMRSVADKYLHVQIRNREVVPDMQEVSCSLELESLLSEICRYLKIRPETNN